MRKTMLALTLAAVAVPGQLAAASPPKVEARYLCPGRLDDAQGSAGVTQGRSETGELVHQNVTWLSTSMAARAAGMRIQWQTSTPSLPGWGKGFVAFDRTVDRISLSIRSHKKVVMELRASSDPYPEDVAVLRNPADLEYGGHFAADVLDVLAMARGSQSLFLVSRTRAGKVIETAEIESTAFAVPVDRINALIAQMNADTTPLNGRCTDLTEIVV